MIETETFETIMTYAQGKNLRINNELVWERNQIVLRKRHMGEIGGFSSESDYHKAVAVWTDKCKQFLASTTHQISLSEYESDHILIGRENELREMYSLLNQSKNSKLLLFGFGGIGKTSLARQYLYLHQKSYDGILSISCNDSFLHTIIDDHLISITNFSYQPELFSSDRKYFNKKWTLFTQLLSKGQYLLLLDDLPHCTGSEWKKIASLPCDVILTSREKSRDWNGETLEIKELKQGNDWHLFYRTMVNGSISETKLEALNAFKEQVSGNTLLMKIALRNLDYFQSMKRNYDDYFVRSEDLNKNEKLVLQNLSILPPDGIETCEYHRASNISEEMLQHLIDRSLVQTHMKGQRKYYQLHPVIKDIVFRHFSPTASTCHRFLEGLASKYTYIWNSPFSEVQEALPICRSILSAFSQPAPWLSDVMDAFITVLWIGGHFKEAEVHCLKLFHACEDYYGTPHQITGKIALRVAAIYHNSMRFDEAYLWYQKAYDILISAEMINSDYHYICMQAAEKLSRHYRHRERYADAKEYWDISDRFWNLYIHESPSIGRHPQIAYYLHMLEQAKLDFKEGNLRSAEALCRQVLKQHEEKMGTDNYTHVEINVLLCEILLKSEKLSQAKALAYYCLDKASIHRAGEFAKETLSIKELLADIYVALGETDKAFSLYREILSTLQQYYPLQKMWKNNLKMKQDALI